MMLCDCNWQSLFAVLAELRRMQERISVIEAKLAQNRHSTHSASSDHLLPAAETSSDCVMDQLSASQTFHTSDQKSEHLNQSLLKTSSTDGTNSPSSTCTLSTTKSQVSVKPGDVIFVSVVMMSLFSRSVGVSMKKSVVGLGIGVHTCVPSATVRLPRRIVWSCGRVGERVVCMRGAYCHA